MVTRNIDLSIDLSIAIMRADSCLFENQLASPHIYRRQVQD